MTFIYSFKNLGSYSWSIFRLLLIKSSARSGSGNKVKSTYSNVFATYNLPKNYIVFLLCSKTNILFNQNLIELLLRYIKYYIAMKIYLKILYQIGLLIRRVLL